VRLFRKRARLRPLDERECYLRLHGPRTGEIEIVELRRPETPVEPPATGPTVDPPATGPTEDGPALHLLIAYPRNAGRLTGEQVRRELLRRMQARTGEAA
jgi:hypothetical protein